MKGRFIFEVLDDSVVICQFTDNMLDSQKLREIMSPVCIIQRKKVSQDFYQELVDDGGFIKYRENQF